MRVNIELDTADYLTLSTSAVSVTLTPQRLEIILSLVVLSLKREAWDGMGDSQWDAWLAGLTEMIEQLQDF